MAGYPRALNQKFIRVSGTQQTSITVPTPTGINTGGIAILEWFTAWIYNAAATTVHLQVSLYWNDGGTQATWQVPVAAGNSAGMSYQQLGIQVFTGSPGCYVSGQNNTGADVVGQGQIGLNVAYTIMPSSGPF